MRCRSANDRPTLGASGRLAVTVSSFTASGRPAAAVGSILSAQYPAGVAGTSFSSVGLLVPQLEEKAAKLRELAKPLIGRQLLVQVQRLAQDPATWRGDIKNACQGWLDVFDSWIGNCLGQPLVEVAMRLEHHITELNDLSRYAGMGMCPAPPKPMPPIRSEPGGLPHFELQMPRPTREPVSMTPDAMRALANALSGAQEEIKAHECKLRDVLAPVVMPPAEPTIDLGPASAHLPVDAAAAVGHPKWYLAVAVELDKARAEILTRAKKWEDAGRATDGMAAASMLAVAFSPLEALRARAVQRAATGHSSAFALAAVGPTPPATPRDHRRKAESDAKRVMEELRGGFFKLQDRKAAEKILTRAADAAAASPEYAAAFLKKLGPKGLRKLIDEGMDPCLVTEVVARASVAGVDTKILKDALGNNRFEKPQRAAQLAGCVCPDATLHPAWAEYLVTTLHTAPDTKPLDPADPRRWYRQAAATVIREHLARPPAGKEHEADDVLERLIAFASKHELDPVGKRALAKALAVRSTLDDIGRVLRPGRRAKGDFEGSFEPAGEDLAVVIPDLMADREARRIMLDAAEAYAATQVMAAVNGPPASRDRRMQEVGALFGAITSRPYSMQAATDVRHAVEKSVTGLLETAGGKVLDAATKGVPGIALVIEGGKAIVFDIAGESSDLRAKEREIKDDRERLRVQTQLRIDLQAEIEHLTYVAVLSDPARRAALGLRLSPQDVPGLTKAQTSELGLGTTTRAEWQDALFDNEGRLRVPNPADSMRWTMFQAWVETVNPMLSAEVGNLTETAFNAMNSVRSA